MRLYSAPNATFPPDAAQHGVVVAVSGGSDSVAMTRLACEMLPQASIIAHFNHAMRGKESDADARFVEKLAVSLGVRCVVERFAGNAISRDDSGSIEATLRAARYDFLRKTAESLGFRYIATGHTRDDQVETVLHRILRGTGLAGLAAIPQYRMLSDAVTLVRPLLHITRETLRDYLADIKQPFCYDASNSDAAFTRNRIRNTLLPLLRAEFNPAVDDALVRLAWQAAAWQDDLTPVINTTLDAALITATPHSVTLNLAPLRAATPTLLRAVLIAIWSQQHWSRRAMGQHHWERLAALVLSGSSNSVAFPAHIVVTVTGSEMQISVKRSIALVSPRV